MQTKTNVSVDVLNRIREMASVDYQSAVPIATANAGVIRDIGAIIMDSPNLQNEFLNCLINRIGKVIITSRLFESPLRMFVKGNLEYGEVVEEIFVNLCRPYQYSPNKAEQEVFKRVIPDVRSAFHVLNSELFYKQTVSRKELDKAFLSIDGVESLARAIIGVMYTSANFDEFVMMKYMLAKAALDGTIAIVPVATLNSEANGKAALTAFKEYSNNFEVLSTNYNVMGVYNSSDKASQYLITDNHNDAYLSANVLAALFGPAFADADYKKIRVDNFDQFDNDRLKWILGKDDDEEWTAFTSDELAALANIEAVLLDENWFQVYYKLLETRYLENPEGLSENTWLHIWRIFSRSPFANIVIFGSGTNGVSAVAIDDSTVPTVTAGTAGSATIDVDITLAGLVPKGAKILDYTVTTSQGATGKASINEAGLLTWNNAFTAADTITVTVTSRIDTTKTDSATITVAAAQ